MAIPSSRPIVASRQRCPRRSPPRSASRPLQRHNNAGTAAGAVVGRYGSAVRDDDGPSEGEAETVPAGGPALDEALEHPGLQLRGEPGAVVVNSEPRLVVARGNADGDP